MFMKILYNGIYCDKNIFSEIINKSKGAIPFAQYKVENLIIEGIKNNRENIDISILSTLPIPRYPKYKKIFINNKIDKKNSFKLIYLKFINFPVFKQITVMFSIIYNTIKWSFINNDKKEEKYVLIYGTNPVNVLPLVLLRKICKYKIITIVSEIDSLRNLKDDTIVSKIKSKIFVMVSKFLENSFDAYILMSRYMNERINKKNNPSIVIEGMIDENIKNIDFIPYKDRNKHIVYAGSLNKKYGIDKLVEAFNRIENMDYKLLIYGDGDYKEKLIDICKNSKNIIYKGIISNEELFEIERNVKLLINPRPSNEILTRYSFPSKTLEYMSSGTVMLITKLKGIPEEYYKYCYYFEDETVNGFEKKISEVIHMPDEELEKMAIEAKNFAIINKNSNKQMKKLIDFIKIIGGN